MPFCQLPSGVTLHYETNGSGPPLIFIHGWAMSGRVWHFQSGELADSFRTITLDLRGHGASPAPAEGFTIVDFARDLVHFFDSLDLSAATAVGWSMGVQVLLQAFPALQQRLAALVLVAGTPRFTASPDYLCGLPPMEVQGMGIRLKRNYQKAMGDFFKEMFAEGELSAERYQHVAREIVLGSRLPEPGAAYAALADLARADQRSVLPLVGLPVLLIHGDRDTICLPTASHYMAGKLANAELRIMAGVGHGPFLSQPELFNDILRDFLRRIYA